MDNVQGIYQTEDVSKNRNSAVTSVSLRNSRDITISRRGSPFPEDDVPDLSGTLQILRIEGRGYVY